jgi:hypothetical protein
LLLNNWTCLNISVHFSSRLAFLGGGKKLVMYMHTYARGWDLVKRTGEYRGEGLKFQVLMSTYFMDGPFENVLENTSPGSK